MNTDPKYYCQQENILTKEILIDLNESISMVNAGECDRNNLSLEIEKLRERMLLCAEILQYMRQSDDISQIFLAIATKLLNLFHAVQVSIYKLDKSGNTNPATGFSGKILAEANSPYCESCSQINIENILNDEYEWLQSTKGEILERYAAGLARCEINLTEKFVGKAYLLMPIVLAERDRDLYEDDSLWGFLSVRKCSATNGETFNGIWGQDDVVMLQQIAMQIELTLQRANRDCRLSEEIEESNRAYEILCRWTQQYRALVEEIPNVSYVSPIANTPEFAYISPQLQELLGVPSEEWNAGFFNSWTDYVHPGDRDRVQQEVRKTIETGEPFCSEYRFVSCTGKIIWVRDNARIGLAIDGKTRVLRGSAFDISDRKESELKFKAIFNNTFQFVGLLTLDGILLEANQTALDFGGITRDDAIGIPFWQTHWFAYSEDIQNRLQQSIREAAQGEFIRYEVDVLGVGGTIITIDFSIRPLKDESGELVLLIPEGRDISQLKEIEQNLRKSESMLLESQQIAKLGNWRWNVASDEIIWSPQLFKILGRDPSLGTPTYAELLLMFVEEDRKKLDLVVQQAVNNGDSYHLELQIIHSDRSYKYVTAIGHAEYDNNGQIVRLYGTLQDISDRKLIEQNLRKSEARLVEAQRIAKLGNWQWDLSSNEIVGSDEFFNILDLDPALGSFSYEDIAPIFLREDRESLERSIDLARNYGESYSRELRIPHSENSYRYLEAIGHAEYGDNGKAIRLYGTLQDISDRKQIEAKLALAKLAEASNLAKSKFLAIMSHELRTPMNAVIGMTGILLDTPLSAQQKQYVSTIRNGGQILLSVINNILDFSRIESGNLEIEEHPFYLEQCIEEVLDLMSSRIAEKSIELTALINLELPKQIIGDYNRLRQILLNLVSNAIKFTESGEIVITVDSRSIDREINAIELLFTVRDTGIGIAPEAIGRLFKSFSQADSSIARQYGGTGLGLAICKQLCELMGGEIRVESIEGQGSTFSFSICITEIATEEIAITPELQGKRILVVNNHPTTQQAIDLYTKPWGIETYNVASPYDALKSLAVRSFDAVLVDIQCDSIACNLPRDIKEIFPDLPVVLLASVKAIAEPITNSFNATLTKPLAASKLYQTFIGLFTSQHLPVITNNYPAPMLDKNFARQHPFQILIVEDNPANRQILLLMLQKLGYSDCKAVANGLDAVEALTNQSYDLVFMDIQLPIMDGLTASRVIRQLPDRQPWIICLSASASTLSREEVFLAGIDEYLSKPLPIEDLVAVLQRVPQRQVPTHCLIDLKIIKSLENTIDEEGLSESIKNYLEHSSQAISNMREAFRNQDFATISKEIHALKGGSGTFGATHLWGLCRVLESLCKPSSQCNRPTTQDIEKINRTLRSIEEEFVHVAKSLQSRRQSSNY